MEHRAGSEHCCIFGVLCSLTVSAEPFGSPCQPVPLDLLHLPRGLTSLELKNVDVITPPAMLAAAAGAALHQVVPGTSIAAARQAEQNRSSFESVLNQLACLKLESCRLRNPQLQVRAKVAASTVCGRRRSAT